jgi:hypothetical protein
MKKHRTYSTAAAPPAHPTTNRLYRVRRGKVPGTFYYTVLDNGVTSAEYWRIIGAWAVVLGCLVLVFVL